MEHERAFFFPFSFSKFGHFSDWSTEDIPVYRERLRLLFGILNFERVVFMFLCGLRRS